MKIFLSLLTLTLFQCQSLNLTFSSFVSIAQGFSTEKQSIFTVLRPKNKAYYYTYLEKNQPETEKKVKLLKTDSRKYSKWVLDAFVIKDLNPSKNYLLRVKNSRNQTKDERQFQSLSYEKKSLRFAVTSCMRYKGFPEQKYLWREMVEKDPDMIFLIGDNVYTTWNHYIADKKDLWKFYVLTRNKLPLYASKKLIPILASWDDHDYGYNNGDKRYLHKKESYDIFQSFFGSKMITSPYLKTGHGINFVLNAFGHRFVFMDNRSFRENGLTHWGEKQKKWLFKELKRQVRPTWLINGNQMFGGYHPHESFEGGFKKEFKKLLKSFNQVKSPIAFITGDRHLFELMKIEKPDLNYKTYEVTSSGIASYLRDKMWEKNPNPRQVKGISNVHNYAIIHTKRKARNHFDFKLEVFGKSKKLYSTYLSVKK